jgi:undecaprenyl-diphosphatase
MTTWESLLLGMVQGATEFLPVSSSGHLVIGQAILDIRIPGVAFEVAVHLGTLVSVLLVYRRRVADLVMGVLRGRPDAWTYFGLILVATLPAGFLGVAAGDFLEALFEAPAVAGLGLLVTGSFLWSSRGAVGRGPEGSVDFRIALLMGMAQAFAIVPGISRSGATVVAGLWLGVEAEEAAAFSFLMAVPAILGAAVLQLPGLGVDGAAIRGGPLLYGSGAAALTGVLAIWTFVAMLRRRAFHRFGPYCWAVGASFLLFLTFRG